MNQLLQDITPKLQNLQQETSNTKNILKLLTEIKIEDLQPLDRARFYTTLSFGLASLVFVLLKTQGCPTQSHPIKQELASKF